MPVIRAQTLSQKPDWLKASALGLFRVPRGNPAAFDLHYHDADEIWYIVEGRARILTEGDEYEVGPGDVVCTGMGDEHHVLEVYEDLLGFFLEGELEGLKRPGHLHRDEHGAPVPRRRRAGQAPAAAARSTP
jgi:mannose-6-phosphate isomerase-like protein (cupin superfamily)